jgi:hypothetical protein
MPLSHSDWESIYQAIQRALPAHEVTYGAVVKRDVKRKLVWLKEFGDQPIPLVGFKGEVTYYDTTPTGVKKKVAKIEPEVPNVGEIVVVLRQMGSRRLPKCVGVVLSRPGSYVI